MSIPISFIGIIVSIISFLFFMGYQIYLYFRTSRFELYIKTEIDNYRSKVFSILFFVVLNFAQLCNVFFAYDLEDSSVIFLKIKSVYRDNYSTFAMICVLSIIIIAVLRYLIGKNIKALNKELEDNKSYNKKLYNKIVRINIISTVLGMFIVIIFSIILKFDDPNIYSVIDVISIKDNFLYVNQRLLMGLGMIIFITALNSIDVNSTVKSINKSRLSFDLGDKYLNDNLELDKITNDYIFFKSDNGKQVAISSKKDIDFIYDDNKRLNPKMELYYLMPSLYDNRFLNESLERNNQ